MMQDMDGLIELLLEFRDERNWDQFHNPKDLALAISVEAAELSELFLWKDAHDVDRSRVAEELADVIIYALFLAEKYGFDLEEIVRRKVEINRKNYPVSLSKGNARKHH